MIQPANADAHSLAAWQTLLAAVVGGILSFGGAYVAKRAEERRQAKALRSAFCAEIGGLVKIAEIRNHEAAARAWIAAWQSGQDFIPKMFGVPQDNDPVYSNNVAKIGVLGEDASDVVLFYTFLKAIRVHLRVLESGELIYFPIDQRVAFVQQALDLWARALPLARDLTARLAL